MNLIKNIFVWLLTIVLLSLLGVLILLKYPIKEPPYKPSSFAHRPKMDHLPDVKIEVLETGYSSSPEAFVKLGGDLFKMQRMIHPAILIHHPKGIVILDSGLGNEVEQEVQEAGWAMKLFPFKVVRALGQQPRIQELKDKIRFFVISHIHWDHISGLLDVPEVPIRILPAEKEFAMHTKNPYEHGIFPPLVEKIKDRIQPLELTDTPYENFSKSLDLFGDQSIVVVPLPGHTPGSLGVFVNLPSGKRFFLIGDAVWNVDTAGNPQPRPLLAELFSDFDRHQARLTRRRLQELIEHSNEITLVPTHDEKALEKVSAISTQHSAVSF
jgi:glyoxylase-like metal-dependent hydrolase (beta-lactamase superfamily II)